MTRPDPDPVRFAWHPEPELVGIRDAELSRPALERLGRDAWQAGLDYIYGEAFRRAIGEPADYLALRRTFFGSPPDGGRRQRTRAPLAGLPTRRPPDGAAILEDSGRGWRRTSSTPTTRAPSATSPRRP